MIKNLPVINFIARRGDNFNSNKFTLFNGVLPPNLTDKEIQDGIESGLYSFKDWRDYEIKAACYSDNNFIFNLTDYMTVSGTGQFIYFSMTAEQTNNLGNLFLSYPAICKYDLQICKKQTNSILKTNQSLTLFTGTFKILGDITRENCEA